MPSCPATVTAAPNKAEKQPPRVTRSRNTTVYGKHKGKVTVEAKRTPLTKEWLLREGAKLACAAASPQTCFLQPQLCSSTTTAVETAASTVLQAVGSDEKSAVLTRPTRVLYSVSSCKAKRQLEASIFELVRSKTPRLV